MMATALSILGFALLFALFGVLRPRRRCQSNCGGCSSACNATDPQEHA
jgi:hypothetical protein